MLKSLKRYLYRDMVNPGRLMQHSSGRVINFLLVCSPEVKNYKSLFADLPKLTSFHGLHNMVQGTGLLLRTFPDDYR